MNGVVLDLKRSVSGRDVQENCFKKYRHHFSFWKPSVTVLSSNPRTWWIKLSLCGTTTVN